MKDLKLYITESILGNIDDNIKSTDDAVNSINDDVKHIKEYASNKTNYKKKRSRFDGVSIWETTIDLKSYALWEVAGINENNILYDNPEYRYMHIEIIKFTEGEPTEVNIAIPVKNDPSKWMTWRQVRYKLNPTEYSKLPVIVNYISTEIFKNTKNIVDIFKNAERYTSTRKY